MNDPLCILPGYEPRQGPVSQRDLYRTAAPDPSLNRWVHSFWQLMVPAGRYNYRSIPDNCVDWIVTLEDRPGNFIIPPFPSPRVFPLAGPVTYFGIRFRVMAHTALFPVPAGRLEGDPSAEDIAAPRGLHQIFDSLLDNQTFHQRCRALGEVLPLWLTGAALDSRVVRFVMDAHLRCRAPHEAVPRLSESYCLRFGLSARQLRRLCHLHLGVGPKQFTRVLRFQASLASPDQGRAPGRLPPGFCDQGHFIREFKALSGATPGTFDKLSVLSNIDAPEHDKLGFPC